MITKSLRHAGGPLIIAVAVLLAALGGDHGRMSLRFDPSAVLDGEVWRLVSGHLVHLGWGHSVLNLAGLAVVAFAVASVRPRTAWWLVVGLISIAVIDGGFFVLLPGLEWYVGLSGVLHGYWVAAGVAVWRSGERLFGATLILALAGKLVSEWLLGPGSLSEQLAGGNVVTEAHLYGAVGGLLAVALLTVASRHGLQAVQGPL